MANRLEDCSCKRRWQKRESPRPGLSRDESIYAHLGANASWKLLHSQEFLTIALPQLNDGGFVVDLGLERGGRIVRPLQRIEAREGSAHLLPPISGLDITVSSRIGVRNSGRG